MRDNVEESIPWPEESNQVNFLCGFFQRWSFSYMNPLLTKGSHQKLSDGTNLLQKDLYSVPLSMQSSILVEKFYHIYEEQKESKRRLLKTLWLLAAPLFIPAGFCELLSVLCQVAVPLLVMQLLRELEENPAEQVFRAGVPYAVLIFLSLVLNAFGNHRHRHLALKSGIVMRAAIMAVVYKNVLMLSPDGRAGLTSGEVNNLVAVDTQKIYEVTQEAHLLWAMPLSIALVTACLLVVQGPSTLVGVAVLVLFVPIVERISSAMMAVRKERVKFSDERVQIVSGMLKGIKTTKLNNYEEKYDNRVAAARRKEMLKLQRELAFWACNTVCMVMSPVLATAASFLTYVLVSEGNILTSSDTFTVLLLFNALRFPINFFGRLVGKAAQALTSLHRIAEFLNRELREDEDASTCTGEAIAEGEKVPDEGIAHDGSVLSVANSSFQIGLKSSSTSSVEGKEYSFRLSGVNFSLKRSEVLAVCGPVGSGKSTLINGIIGEANASPGSILSVRGSISYVSQSAFILNATLRDNILFGLPYDLHRYKKVVDACCLGRDIKQLGVSGDLTEIGERGVTLSGGQKQRVSLARAVYSGADLILLDDPLSALDAGTSKQVFERLIKSKESLLSNSAIVLVTHAAHFLSFVDKVLVVVNGETKFLGTWPQLLNFKADDSKTSEAIEHIRSSVQEGDSGESLDSSKGSGIAHTDVETIGFSNDKTNVVKSIMTTEVREHGKSSLKTWVLWFRYAGGCPFTVITVLLLTLDRIVYVAVEYWIARWTEGAYEPIAVFGVEFPAQTEGRSAQSKYLAVYFILIAMTLLTTFVRSEWTVTGGARCSRRIFIAMLSRVLRAPMSYFETTPMGRILNRFTHDTEVIDTRLNESMTICIIATSWFLAGVVIMCTIIPWMALAIFPVLLLYRQYLLHYRNSGADLQRLDALARSPVQTMLSEVIDGSAIIRTFRQEYTFTEKFHAKADKSSSALLNFVSAQRWLGIRIELLGAFIVLVACVLVVTLNGVMQLKPGIAALLIIWASNFTIALNFLVDSFAEAEAAITSIERIDDMSRLPQEKDFETSKTNSVPDSWPENGSIEFEKVYMRYRKELPLALENLSFRIASGRRCGVVGRTGAGKSSLSTALFRLVEIEQGRICLDGVDLGQLGLSDVRGRKNGMAIIPQDPFLTGTTVRECLDPFGLSSDEDILDAITAVRLADSSDSIEVLERTLEEGGVNFSVGERQLLSLARALLQKPSLLILDEATASVDGETDAFIQRTLRTRFQETTLITVAHRLNTIMDYDMILVMDAGKVVEQGSPFELLKQNGIFAELVDATGDESSKALRGMVVSKDEDDGEHYATA